MSIMNVVSLFAGLGLFLFGMKTLSDGLEKAAGSGMRKLLEKLTRNRLLAMFAGFLITALIQSSSATTVMVVGFVNAGILNLTQAIGVIMGANVGTTVTSLLLSIKVDFGAILCFLGLLLTNAPGKKLRRLKEFGPVAMGLGILFVGMNTMSDAMAPLRTWPGFTKIIVSMSSNPLEPLIGVLVGAGITAVLQSSAASIGILQALAGEGLIPMQTCMFILFGQNIGTCVTALLACSGANATAKRTAVVHLLFNIIGTVIFVLVACLLPFADWVIAVSGGNLRLQIAVTHIVFNVVTTLLLLPAAGLLEKAACMLVREDKAAAKEMKLKYFDKRFLQTPPVAAAQLFLETQRMGRLAQRNLKRAVECFNHWDDELAAEVTAREDQLDFLNREITAQLVELRALNLSTRDGRLVGSLFHVVNDMERIGDHSFNILDGARLKKEESIQFTDKAVDELADLYQKVYDQMTTALDMFTRQSDDADMLQMVEAVEEEIDLETDALRDHHVERLKNRKCTARNGMLYLDMLTNLERIGDHCENIATSVDKGDKN